MKFNFATKNTLFFIKKLFRKSYFLTGVEEDALIMGIDRVFWI